MVPFDILQIILRNLFMNKKNSSRSKNSQTPFKQKNNNQFQQTKKQQPISGNVLHPKILKYIEIFITATDVITFSQFLCSKLIFS